MYLLFENEVLFSPCLTSVPSPGVLTSGPWEPLGTCRAIAGLLQPPLPPGPAFPSPLCLSLQGSPPCDLIQGKYHNSSNPTTPTVVHTDEATEAWEVRRAGAWNLNLNSLVPETKV